MNGRVSRRRRLSIDTSGLLDTPLHKSTSRQASGRETPNAAARGCVRRRKTPLAEPPTGGRVRDPEVRSDGHVSGALDEIPKPVVVALLKASHADEHRPFAHAAQLLEAVRAVSDASGASAARRAKRSRRFILWAR